MPIDREITKPMLGSDQEPTALTWKSTLRSPTASPRGPRQSRSRTRSSGLTMSLRSRTPSPTVQSISKENNLRKSSSGKLGASFGKSTEMKVIENDYVKNLQQQIYFLELEANFLREQAKKATEMHPQMTAEAERMLSKLRELQGDVDDYQVELRRKDASLQLLTDEKYKILAKLTQVEDERQRMKQLLQDEIAEIKVERDQITLENVRLDNQIQRLMAEKESTSSKLRESQNISAVIKSQLNEKEEQQRLLQISLEEKRSQCIDAEVRAERVEEHYLNTTQRAHEQQIQEYKTEIRLLTQQLKEQERQAHDERYLKNKTQDDNDKLAKTNMMLKRQVDEVENQVLKEQKMRDELEASQTEDMMKISVMADKEKELRLTLRSTQQELSNEKERSNRYLSQLRVEKEEKANLESTNNSIKMESIEMETRIEILEKENSNLRKDKEILTDHVADLQGQMAQKESQLTSRKHQIRELERELNMAESERMADEHMQSDKWKEFETLADGMKKLSRTMARTSTTKSPRSSAKLS